LAISLKTSSHNISRIMTLTITILCLIIRLYITDQFDFRFKLAVLSEHKNSVFVPTNTSYLNSRLES
ncbi:uncharacterized protein LOC112539448, partial [Tetranychus urticae]|uniref:uncharacterized protein LOC112539448 n=1 Tax=Tetranychus urticae TaxID=32264 RepID=UPI000D65CA09